MTRDLQWSELNPLCANVLGESGPPGEMMNRGGRLIRPPLDMTSRLDPTISACELVWSARRPRPGSRSTRAERKLIFIFFLKSTTRYFSVAQRSAVQVTSICTANEDS